jgi:phospholipid/cholesterol/gamma-HCH transport system ATP-binding protein
MDEKPVLVLDAVHYSPSDLPLLKNISLSVYKGEVIVLAGKSGSGKTLLLKLIAGLLRPDTGRVLRAGMPAKTSTRLSWCEPGPDCCLVFQDAALLDEMQVWENIGIYWLEQSPLPLAEIQQEVKKIALETGLSVDDLTKLPSELSGGMRKKTALARAMSRRPDIILYDEPTAGLDPAAAHNMAELILALQQQQQNVSILVTHDKELLARPGIRVLYLQDGRIYFDGDSQTFYHSEDAVIREFLGPENNYNRSAP